MRNSISRVRASVTRLAAQQAYEMAGLGPEDLHLVELHDCFATAELLQEALRQAGVPVHFEVVPGKGHAIGPPPEAIPGLTAFLHEHLGLRNSGQ